ncbi:MAG TPA: amidohydrolase family protein [Candidatus Acidoferrum sp.]|nr:amidohydrolase family protein [Candidatus Acidoferrum sp.]
MRRRTFLGSAVGALAMAQTPPPIIDCHIHLFDPTRPQGVPWPPAGSEICKPTLPDRFRRMAAPLGVHGAIEIECSPWLEDNQWVLDVAEKDRIIVGTVGNLEPGTPDFARQLERFHRNPLFRGIRYGNLWGRSLAEDLAKPEFVAGLKLVADAGLVLDTANPDPALIATVVRVTDGVPALRVVIDHLPQCNPPSEGAARKQYDRDLRELAARPQVYVKISQVLRRVDGRVPRDLAFYRPRLDELWDLFGEDRLLYGSDWPNSDPFAPYDVVLALVREYFAGKGSAAAAKYFAANSQAAYRWAERKA